MNTTNPHAINNFGVNPDDPRLIEYLKINPDGNYYGFQNYCGELFKKEVDDGLFKYAIRNQQFLEKINHWQTMLWVQEYMSREPQSHFRDQEGDSLFSAILKIGGCYNSLMMEISKDEFSEKDIQWYMDVISQQRIVLEKQIKD